MLVREFLVVVSDLADDGVLACAGRTLGLVLCDASVKAGVQKEDNSACEGKRNGKEGNETDLW